MRGRRDHRIRWRTAVPGDKPVIPDALDTANSGSAEVLSAEVLDESVLDALGQLQGKWRPDFVDRVITIFLETALDLLTDLKNGSANGPEGVQRHYRGGIAFGPLRRVGNDSASRFCA